MILIHFTLLIFGLNLVKSDYFEVGLTEGRSIPGSVMNIQLKVRKINKTSYAINGILSIKEPLDDTYQLRLMVFKKQGNEYRLTPFHIGPNNFCDYIQNKALTYDDLLECTNLPARNVCPWQIKDYNLTNCLTFLDKVPNFFSGDYRADVELLKNGESIGGYQTFFYVINMINSRVEKLVF